MLKGSLSSNVSGWWTKTKNSQPTAAREGPLLRVGLASRLFRTGSDRGYLRAAVGGQFGELFVRRAARHHRFGNPGASFVLLARTRIVGSRFRRVAVRAM